MGELLDALSRAFAPHGHLRAAINLGNPMLSHRDPISGAPGGVSVDLAYALGRELELDVELVAVERAAESVDAVRSERADVGFFAIDPARSDGLRFTAPYLLIEGSYLVPAGSPVQDNAEVDRAAHRVGVALGSAYDLFLTRELQAAQLERVLGAAAVLAAVHHGTVEVAAGIRQQLAGWVSDDPALRLLPGRFMVIQQAMGLPAGRGELASAALTDFVERMKASGFVAESIDRHGVEGASVAPAA